ncbi:peptide-methionine (S)-S-oxide reductase [Humitalea rosea]|uniref:Peptide methionine sulfoxide reductase MsrA n=1 Tax=Humitalea rosea TaxID=990373 RepID=A0A2W7IQ62_9PROT|nr:peptide-methionine (S)-S-oxide reductase MsrA [Humitalea rosea]PZW48018.1 peptide-methionine (S)-S-oxide reductase [Humitalea rosea]
MTDGPLLPGLQRTTLGGGCFWCLDAVYRKMKGVRSSLCAYAGGHQDNPSYEQVCGKRTGHAEVVQLDFDPAEVSYADILKVFFTIHDPTTQDRQGNDVGPQYRSVIFLHDMKHEAEARAAMAAASDLWGAPVVTELLPAPKVWEAEAEHQDYFVHNPWSGYCMAVVAPKVAKARKGYAHLMEA